MQKLTTLFALFLFCGAVSAQVPVMVKDINPGFSPGAYSTASATVIGNTLYFTGVDDLHGEELWKTDGTADGTVLIKDINVGIQASQQDFYAVYNDQLYFVAFTPDTGDELWRTDASEGAVLLLGDLCPSICGGAFYGTKERVMAEFNGKLFLRLNTANEGYEPWVTDGTAAGSMLLKDIKPGNSESNPYGFTVFQGKLYFAADSTELGTELWVTDGTAAGTHLVKNIHTGSFGSNEMDTPVVGSDAFYFWARSSYDNGPELWKSDGTLEGTMLVKDINPGPASGQPPYVNLRNSAWIGNQLLFTATDGVTGAELWITDGTTAGTLLLSDINPGSAGSNIQFLDTLNGKAIFRAKNASNGNEIWISDGTAAGTKLLKDIRPGTGDGMYSYKVDFIAHANKMYFTADDGAKGAELWITDGTTSGTKLLFDITPGAALSDPATFRVMGDYLYFFAENVATGRELWKLSLATSATTTPANKLALELYPSLSQDGIFYINYTGEPVSALAVNVYDAVGSLTCHVIQSPTEPLRLGALSAGVYFVRITTENGRFTVQKIVIE